MDSTAIADLILARLTESSATLTEQMSIGHRVRSGCVDDLLPHNLAHALFESFPDPNRMVLKRSIKENKLVGAQMDQFNPALEEAVYAFQDPRVVQAIEAATGLRDLEPDVDLYAGGISLMTKGGYLRPHLDNSHDAARQRYRVLNLLYYVTPNWQPEWGGSLQLWDDGPHGPCRTIPSTFNRLVLMVTNRRSWHSVNEITHEGRRCCISNYYFSKHSPDEGAYFHATSFRAEQPSLSDRVMAVDNALRTTILKVAPGAYKNPHVYKRPQS